MHLLAERLKVLGVCGPPPQRLAQVKVERAALQVKPGQRRRAGTSGHAGSGELAPDGVREIVCTGAVLHEARSVKVDL
jgi:hypothetical protein